MLNDKLLNESLEKSKKLKDAEIENAKKIFTETFDEDMNKIVKKLKESEDVVDEAKKKKVEDEPVEEPSEVETVTEPKPETEVKAETSADTEQEEVDDDYIIDLLDNGENIDMNEYDTDKKEEDEVVTLEAKQCATEQEEVDEMQDEELDEAKKKKKVEDEPETKEVEMATDETEVSDEDEQLFEIVDDEEEMEEVDEAKKKKEILHDEDEEIFEIVDDEELDEAKKKKKVEPEIIKPSSNVMSENRALKLKLSLMEARMKKYEKTLNQINENLSDSEELKIKNEYLSKLLKTKNFTTEQKLKITDKFDNAKSLDEVKKLYESYSKVKESKIDRVIKDKPAFLKSVMENKEEKEKSVLKEGNEIVALFKKFK